LCYTAESQSHDTIFERGRSCLLVSRALAGSDAVTVRSRLGPKSGVKREKKEGGVWWCQAMRPANAAKLETRSIAICRRCSRRQLKTNWKQATAYGFPQGDGNMQFWTAPACWADERARTYALKTSSEHLLRFLTTYYGLLLSAAMGFFLDTAP